MLVPAAARAAVPTLTALLPDDLEAAARPELWKCGEGAGHKGAEAQGGCSPLPRGGPSPVQVVARGSRGAPGGSEGVLGEPGEAEPGGGLPGHRARVPLAGDRLGAGHGCGGRHELLARRGKKRAKTPGGNRSVPASSPPPSPPQSPSLPLRPLLTEPQEPHQTSRHGGGATPQGSRRSPPLAGGLRAAGWGAATPPAGSGTARPVPAMRHSAALGHSGGGAPEGRADPAGVAGLPGKAMAGARQAGLGCVAAPCRNRGTSSPPPPPPPPQAKRTPPVG